MSVEGSLDLFSLPEILQMISQQGKTGILTIQGQQDIVAVSFLGGRIVAADSLAHTVEEGLSKLLVSEGLIGAAEFESANAENQVLGGRLLDLLVERRHLTRQQLLGALRLQTVRQLEALLHWQEGDFKFYGGDEVSFEEGFEPISVEDLLLRTLADFNWTPAGKRADAGAVQRPAASQPPRPASGDLWLQEVPELPELSLPMATPGAPRAASPAPAPPPATSPASPPLARVVPLAAGPRAAAAGEAAAAYPEGHKRAARSPGASIDAPAGVPPPAAPVPASGAASAAPAPRPAAGGSPVRPAPYPPAAVAPSAAAPHPAATSAASPSAAAHLGGAGPPRPLAEPLPWPAAVTSTPAGAGAGSAGMAGIGGTRAAGAGSAGAGGARAAGAGGAAGAGAAGGGATSAASLLSSAGAASPAAAGLPAFAPAVPLIPPEGSALPRKYRQMRVDRTDLAGGFLPRLAAAGLALGLVALLAAVARTSPENLLLPFPWEQPARDAFVRNQRESLFDKVAGATKTAFLRDGRFPDRLGQLRDTGLLSPADLRDPRGEPLLYTAHEDSYTLQATERGRPLADAEASESISGNFYLDPSLSQSSAKSGPPIVLLD